MKQHQNTIVFSVAIVITINVTMILNARAGSNISEMLYNMLFIVLVHGLVTFCVKIL